MAKVWSLGNARWPVLMRRTVIILLIVSLCFNVLLINKKSPEATARGQAASYPLLSKRIFAENQNDILINFTSLRSSVREYIGKQSEVIGLYFEYLPSGTSIGVNALMEVELASLIKVPVVMATYRAIEEGDVALDHQLVLKSEHIDQRFGELWKRGVGAKITVSDAIRLTLVDSDNTASKMLAEQLPADALDRVFDSLDLPKKRQGDSVVSSPKSYTSILRSLYLSSYLSRSHSNDVLHILTQTKFNDKLPAGIARGVAVAHKTGVIETPGSPSIYNDCGIVYVPNRPYSLCVMVVGSEDAARTHIQHLSAEVYNYVKSDAPESVHE